MLSSNVEGFEDLLTPEEYAYLNKKKEIVMCVDPDFMPYEKIDNGKYIGMSADYFRLIEQKIGKKIRLYPTENWVESLAAAKKRKCDILSLAMQTPLRQEYLHFTQPYLHTPLVLVTKNEEPFLENIESVFHKKIGVLKGYASVELLRNKYPDINLVEVASRDEALKQVTDGRLYGFVSTIAEMSYFYQHKLVSHLKIVGKFDESLELGIAIRDEEPLLLSVFDKAINAISEREKQEILNHWISIRYEKGMDYTLIGLTMVVSLLIILLGLVRYRILKKHNRRLEAYASEAKDATQLKEDYLEISKLYNQQLKDAMVEKDKAIKAKDEFLVNVSHEIRTPMNAIMGFSHILMQSDLGEKQRNYFYKIKSSADLLLSVINDILDYSKIEAGELEIEDIDFNLNETLDHVSNMIGIKARQKGLEVIFDIDKDTPVMINGDPLRLGQVLVNLMNNAVKFTDAGDITLKVKLLSNQSNFPLLQFTVSDTGIGLTREQIGIMFESFSQVDSSTSRKYGGTGLGLSIAKQLVERMGGEIRVESEYGKGSDFIFTIPLNTRQDTERRRYRLPSKSMMKKKVLIADKSSKTLSVLARTLEYFQFTAFHASSVQELAVLVKMHSYDAVFVDKNLLMSCEKDVIEKLSDVELVLLENSMQITNESMFQNLTIKTHLIKPFNQQTVFNVILELFSKEKMEKIVRREKVRRKDLMRLHGSKILLAEDNEINQTVVFGLLEDTGIEVIIVNNGKEALMRLPTIENIDLILMDINMPIMDGYDTTAQIRKWNQYDHIPIIALSANAMKKDIDHAREVGMQAYLQKPIDVEAFYSVLLEYISVKKEPLRSKRKPGKETAFYDMKPEIEVIKSGLEKETGFYGVKAETAEIKSTPEKKTDFYGVKTETVEINSAPKKESRFEYGFEQAAADDVLDSREGIARVGGNIKLYKKALFDFPGLFGSSVNEFKTLIARQRFSEAKILAHTIKGTSGNLGAKTVFKTVKLLEEAFSDQAGDYTHLLEHYSKALERLMAMITQQKKAEPEMNVRKVLIDEEKLAELLFILYEKAKMRKAIPCKKAAEELESYSWPQDKSDTLKTILADLKQYKFKDAVSTLERLVIA